MSINGSFNNQGKIIIFENGILNVKKDMLNTGDIKINDPEKIKEIIIQSLKTANSISQFGKSIIDKLIIKQ